MSDRLKELPEDIKSKSMSIQQDWVWSNATEEEKTDPKNFQFWYVTDMIASAPKAYSCKYTNHDGSKNKEKIKFKGIPQSALTKGKELTFDIIERAYE